MRLQLLELLAHSKEMSVTELTEALAREESIVSRHLSQLNQQGLVSVRQEAQNRLYSLIPEQFQQVFNSFLAAQHELQVAPSEARKG